MSAVERKPYQKWLDEQERRYRASRWDRVWAFWSAWMAVIVMMMAMWFAAQIWGGFGAIHQGFGRTPAQIARPQ